MVGPAAPPWREPEKYSNLQAFWRTAIGQHNFTFLQGFSLNQGNLAITLNGNNSH